MAEEVVLVNEGTKPVDLSGWVLVSVTGNQRFTFPAGTVLRPGGQVVVRSGPGATSGPGVLVWTRANVWNNQGEPAELRDATGRLVAWHSR
ncbi:MAG: lamin tail domain-containing protein [Bacillota bacterium]